METEAARAELERLKRALRDRGIDGIDWEPIALEPADPAAAVAASLTAAAPASDTDRLRTLVGEILDRCPWCSIPVVRLFPESAKGRVLLRADVLVFDAVATLSSAESRAAVVDGVHPDVAGHRIWDALAARVVAAGMDLPDRQGRLREALSTANMAFGGDREETRARAIEGLGADAGAMFGDLVLLTRRENDHGRTREDLENVLENEVHAPSGRLEGRQFSHGAWAPPPKPIGRGPWRSDPTGGGGDPLPDLAPLPKTSGRAEEIARLGAVVDDEQAIESTRLAALRDLAAIDDPEARAWRIRALGHSTIFLNAVHDAPLAEAQPLFREMVLSRDERRFAGALSLLRRFRRDGLDAAAIWAAAAHHPVEDVEVRHAPLYRESLIERYAETGDASVVDGIAKELPEHADSTGWIAAACRLFTRLGAETQALPAVLQILASTKNDAAPFRAMELFATYRCEAAVPFLRKGIEEGEPMWRSFALNGLAFQGESGFAEVLAWLEKRLSAPPDKHRENDISSALQALGLVGPVPAALLERADAISPRLKGTADWVRNRAAAAMAPVVPAASGVDPVAEEASLAGETPEKTGELRFRLWLSPGYATRRYRHSGHRDPSWDADVIEAHDAYSGADPHPGAHPRIAAGYERAVAKGCRDAIVLYRIGACAQYRGDLATAERRLAEAALLLPAQYPGAPYLSSSTMALAAFARDAGRTAEALEWARRGAGSVAADRWAAGLLASLERAAEMTAIAARISELTIGSTPTAAGRKHRYPITGLAVNGAVEPIVASADAGGFVQIAIAERRASRHDLTPVHRANRHGLGRTVVAWATDHRLLSAGGDRLVKEIDASDPRVPAIVKEHAVDVPVTAIAPIGHLAMGLGDAAGRVFAIEADGRDSPRLVAQLRLGEIRRLVAWPRGEGFVAFDVEGKVAIVDRSGPRTVELSVPARPETAVFAPSGMLVFHGGGDEIFVDPVTGQVADAYPSEEGDRVSVRVSGDREMQAYESGGVNVRAQPGVWYAGSEPLALVDVAWERGVVVMATRAGWLRTTDFRG